MNNPTLRPLVAALLAMAALPLSGCGGPPETPPLADARIGGPLTLVDQDGKAVKDSDFAGKYRLIYFGYTFCPDVCPVDVQTIMKGYRLLRQRNPDLAARVQPIFITVDPERDTPAALKAYTNAFPGLVALTGTPAQIAATAKAFAVYYQKIPAKQDKKDPRPPEQFAAEEKNNYLMDHSRTAMLFGPGGEPLALVAQDKGAEAVAGDIERWAR
ncbi:SCO family protein [Rhizorhabdus dicambivorans]